jgi:hypothetical protein
MKHVRFESPVLALCRHGVAGCYLKTVASILTLYVVEGDA